MDKIIENEDVKLPEGLLEKEFYICCLQLKTPFWDEVTEYQRKNRKYIGWMNKPLEKRKEKLKILLQEIKDKVIAEGKAIKILVFNEYAVEESMMEILEEFAMSNKIIVIAGLYEDNERQSITYIFVPADGKPNIYKQYKLSKSRFDEEYLSDVPEKNKKFYRFLWQPDKGQRENFMQVFVCHDFIKSAYENVDTSTGGLIIVPMNSPRIDEFHGLAYLFVRRAEGHKSIVVLLCNATDISTSKDKEIACGETQICGSYEGRDMIKIERFYEGGLVAKINLNTVLVKPTPIKRSVVITDLIKFSIDESGLIKEPEIFVSKPHRYVVDPNVLLHHVGLHKIYAFYCIKNYNTFMEFGKNLPFQSHVIFGVYDILIQGYEEELKCFRLRLTSYLGEKSDELEDREDLPRPKFYSITHVLKYRGVELMNTSDEKFTPRFYLGSKEVGYIDNNLKNLRKVLIGENIPENLEVEFENKKIIFKVESESDILPEERGRCDEYLVFVVIHPAWWEDHMHVMNEFRKLILPVLMKDDRIRTIEFCGRSGFDGDYSPVNYILHVVGNLNDVRQITLSNIHNLSYEKGIRCRTFVIPIAQPVSKEKYISLEETILRHPQLRERVYEIIYHLKYVNPTNPFIIKHLPYDSIEKITDFYIKYGQYLKEKHKKITEKIPLEEEEEFKKLVRYIYGLCYGFLSNKNLNEEFKILSDYCSPTYLSIVREIETFLDKKRNEILHILSEIPEETRSKYESKLRSTIVAQDKNAYTILMNTKLSILGDLQGLIIVWNKNVVESDQHKIKIEEGDLIDELKKLNKPIRYRNCFSHAQMKEEQGSKKTTKEFVNELFESTIISFEFVLKYCKDVY